MNKSCWLIGAGYMATEYVRVLKSSAVDFTVITRGEEKAVGLQKEFEIPVSWGGLTTHLNKNRTIPDFAIVAVSVEELYPVVKQLLNTGIKNILVEKPGGLYQTEIDDLSETSEQNGINLFIAYNRRFYASVKFLKEKTREDGGITSINFEFTEWVHTIDTNKFPALVLEKFLIANSSHVIDTVFHLVGRPKILSNFLGGNEIEWHKSGSIFAGSGITEHGILFSYISNWGAPGRWGIEICTSKRKYYLKPLERLAIQEKGSVNVLPYEADYSPDEQFKPGLKCLLDDFFELNTEMLCSIQEHRLNFSFYEKIAGYSS